VDTGQLEVDNGHWTWDQQKVESGDLVGDIGQWTVGSSQLCQSPRKMRKLALKCPIYEFYLKIEKPPKLKGTYI
jgi:hypothetical protein